MDRQNMLDTFADFLAQNFNRKSNQLALSNTTIPNRIKKITLDLSLAPGSTQNKNDALYKFGFPFRAVHVERVFSTSTGADKAGQIDLLFDYADITNVQNAKTLYTNDAFTLDQSVSQGFLNWILQTDTSITIAFMIDVDFHPGATKTQIVGTVSTVSLSPPAAPKLSAPSFIKTLYATGNTPFAQYVVPVGKVVKLTTIFYQNQSTFTFGYVNINFPANALSGGVAGGFVFNSYLNNQSGGSTTGNQNPPQVTLYAGTTIDGNSGAGASVYVYIEQFDA